MSWWWSVLLATLGITGLYLAGSGNRHGWLFGIGVQIPWAVYAVTTRQWGFLATSVAYAWVYSRNYLRQRRASRALEPTRPGPWCVEVQHGIRGDR